jgi:CubicO group peptidase (beta-lactamase class C family)
MMNALLPFFPRALACALILAAGSTPAADHLDPPAGAGDPLADILDLYAFIAPLCWSQYDAGCGGDPEELILAITVNPAATGATRFSPDLVYHFHLENEAGETGQIDCSFNREQVVTCTGLGGLSVQSRVGEIARNGDIRVFAGLRDDPFFFDQEAFDELAASGLSAFSPPGADYHAGSNVMALVLGIRISAIPTGAGLGTNIQKIWVASERTADAGLDGAITGSWYNSSQDGQGWVIEVVQSPSGADQFVVYFYGYDNTGGRLWLLGAGPGIEGNTATVEVIRTSGFGFGGDYDPLSMSFETAGTMTFTFWDCNSGMVEFTPLIGDLQAFATDIARLTSIASQDCRFSAVGQVDRMGRPLVAEFFVSEPARDDYNSASDPESWAALFGDEILAGIEVLDLVDGVPGNLFTNDPQELAAMFVDDRLQIDLDKGSCTGYGAIEMADLTAQPTDGCGGRALNYDVVDDTLGLVVSGFDPGVHDYVFTNDAEFLSVFPFLAAPHGPVEYPPVAWEEATPEELGMSSDVLADMVAELINLRDHYRLHEVVVVRNGRLVLDAAFHPFQGGMTHGLASVGKMLTSTLIGIAIDRGYIESVDEPVLSFFPDREIANREARKEAMTIAHLLAQRSGIYHGSDGGHSEEDMAMRASPDWIQWILDQPMASEPGTVYYYSNANLHLAAGILKQATGMAPLEFARRFLYRPLGITDVIWEADPQGVNYGAGGQMHLLPDLARLGFIYLHAGQWMGRQIVSPGWVSRATSAYPGPPPPGWPPDWSLGFAWAIDSQRNFVETAGSGGQAMRLLRDEDVVIATVAGGGPAYNGCSWNAAVIENLMHDYVTGAILGASSLPPNPQGAARLASLVQQAPLPNDGPPGPVPPLPAIVQSISGVRYDLDDNPSHLQWLRLTFAGGSEAFLEYQEARRIGLKVGLDDRVRVSVDEYGLLYSAKGWWMDGNRFAMLLDQPSTAGSYYAEVLFEDDGVTVVLDDTACGEGTVILTGHRA